MIKTHTEAAIVEALIEDAGPVGYVTDDRGLHRLDSGRIFAVRYKRSNGDSRRDWFRTYSEAASRAEYQRAIRRRAAEVLVYDLSNERRVEDPRL